MRQLIPGDQIGLDEAGELELPAAHGQRGPRGLVSARDAGQRDERDEDPDELQGNGGSEPSALRPLGCESLNTWTEVVQALMISL